MEAQESRLLAVKSEALDAQDALENRVLTVKSEKLDAEEAAAKSREEVSAVKEHKRKLDEELDQQRKKLRATEGELEEQKEQLESYNCVICLATKATIGYLPCGHVCVCCGCDATYQGGPDQPAAAGKRSCPSCRGEIDKVHRAFVGC